MCGACGGGPTDWAAGLVGGSYERAVVARVLSSGSPRVRVTTGPSGWMVAVGGRPARLHRTFDSLLDAVVDAGVTALDPQALPRHRAVRLDRGSVRAERRLDSGSNDASAPDRALLDVLAAAISARVAGTEVQLRLADDAGTWTLLVRA
ncbi:hypothetical protein KXS11_10185 [Plantibacter flavus]|uniref:hypothetical protein n=1 Tax=Plantibacter flavus TaxID=150123 RepID=UPI003F1887FF